MEDLELETSVCGLVVDAGYWNTKIETRMADKCGHGGLDLAMMSCLDKRLYWVLLETLRHCAVGEAGQIPLFEPSGWRFLSGLV